MIKKKKKIVIMGIIIICLVGVGIFMYIKNAKVHVQFETYEQKVDKKVFDKYFKDIDICAWTSAETLQKMNVYTLDMKTKKSESLYVSFDLKITDFYYNKYMPEKWEEYRDEIIIDYKYNKIKNGHMYIYKIKNANVNASIDAPLQ